MSLKCFKYLLILEVGGFNQRPSAQSNSQSILYVSLGFSILGVYRLAQSNLNGSYVCFLSIPGRGCSRGVMVKLMNCGIVVSEFEL